LPSSSPLTHAGLMYWWAIYSWIQHWYTVSLYSCFISLEKTRWVLSAWLASECWVTWPRRQSQVGHSFHHYTVISRLYLF
jgi:hypothetical protein